MLANVPRFYCAARPFASACPSPGVSSNRLIDGAPRCANEFARSWRTLRDPTSRLGGWIKLVAARKALMVLRRHRIQGEVSIDGWLGSLRSKESIAYAERITLDDAVRQLPVHLRVVVTMKMIEGFTYPQIAESLGLHVNAAKARIHRARTLLQAYLREGW